MLQAYSRLKRILSKHKMTVPELRRRIWESGIPVTLKSLYRLNDAAQPLERDETSPRLDAKQEFREVRSQTGVWERGDEGTRGLAL